MSHSWTADTLRDLGLGDLALEEKAPASFEELPEPVIHQIISYCDIGDINSLFRVSRSLYHMCRSPYVFQAHFCFHAPIPHAKNLALRINQSLATYYPRAYHYKDFNLKALTVWSHVAVMARKLPDLARELEDLMFPFWTMWATNGINLDYPTKAIGVLEEPIKDIIATFSVFATFGCLPSLDPSFLSVMPKLAITVTQYYYAITRYGQKDRELDLDTRKVALCLALRLLHAPAQTDLARLRHYLGLMNENIIEYLYGKGPHPEYGYDREAYSRSVLNTWERRQIYALLTQSFMMHVLGKTFTGRAESDFLPLSARLPMASQTNEATLPIPRAKLTSEVPRRINAFQSFSIWDAWYRAQVEELFVEIDRGEWVGYMFTTATGRASGTISSLENMRFEMGQKVEDRSTETVIISASSSTSQFGPCRMYGEFCRDLHLLRLRMDPNLGKGNRLFGWLTPMGIAGYVGFHPMASEEGYFWLWKKEWGHGLIEAIDARVPLGALKYYHRG